MAYATIMIRSNGSLVQPNDSAYEKFFATTPLVLSLLVCSILAVTSSLAQETRQDHDVSSVQLPDETAGIDNIVHTLISAFDQVGVLALADTHQRNIDSETPHPDRARSLDRYINGEDVPAC